PLGGDVAVVVGSEATGLERAERQALDGEVTIEMAGRAESLNVGVASALVCFEALRQRAGAEGTPGVRPTI
ncbi:MAG TPA: TrmH family RNA methyltransferase, partial [Acidimicrobiales bacterium]|nr:TrmH family RNA methyltransferase [Acidimicrobiales bacterium]